MLALFARRGQKVEQGDHNDDRGRDDEDAQHAEAENVMVSESGATASRVHDSISFPYFTMRLKSTPPAMTEAICPATICAGRMHQQMVRLIFRKTHLMYHTGCHRNAEMPARRSWGYLLLGEKVDDLTKDHATRGVKDERAQADCKDHEGTKRQEGFRLHVCRNGEAKQ